MHVTGARRAIAETLRASFGLIAASGSTSFVFCSLKTALPPLHYGEDGITPIPMRTASGLALAAGIAPAAAMIATRRCSELPTGH
jgi:hypothetical protein